MPVAGATKFFAKANLRPLFFCALAVFGAITYGYDGTYFTSVLEMDKFKEDYGQRNADGVFEFPSAQRSYSTSIVQAGEFVGALCAGFVGDWFGRRGTFHAAVFCLTLGTLLQVVVAGSIGLLTGGRAVLGMGVGLLANSTPLYLSEISTVAIRGVVVGSWQLMLAIGQVIGACVGQATSKRTDTGAYRIPIAINFLLALILFISQFIIPESPRWLVNKGRDEQAIAALRRLNKDQDDPDTVVELQLRSFREAKREDEELGKDAGWKSLFTQREELRKLMIVCGVLASQQINGIQFVFSYTTTFFAQATGSTGQDDAFIFTIIVTIIEVVGVILSFFVVNRFGRRSLLMWTSIPMVGSLFVCGGLGTIRRNEAQNNTIVAMICIFVLFFNIAWGPLAWVVASECAVGKNRQKLMSLGSATFFIWAFVVAFTLPYLFDPDKGNLGTQIGWIYGVGTMIGIIFVFFCVPETRGRTLEEIGEMLNARVPTRKWTSYVTSVEREAMRAIADEPQDAAILKEHNSSESGNEEHERRVSLTEPKSGKEGDEGARQNVTQAGTHDVDAEERQ